MTNKQITSSFSRTDEQIRQTTNKYYPEPVLSGAGSAADVILADTSPTTTTLVDGQPIQIELAHGSNTTTTPTLQIGTTATKTIVRDDDAALQLGDTGTRPIFSYSESIDKYILMNPFTVQTGNLVDRNVTYQKIQDVSATSRILGRETAGAGVIEEITPANVLTMLGLIGTVAAEAIDVAVPLANGDTMRVILQREVSTLDTNEVFTFPTAFSAVPCVLVQRMVAGAQDILPVSDSVTTTNFTINRDDAVDGNNPFYYIAVGKG